MERKGLQKGGEVGGREGNDDQNWEVRPDGLADKKFLRPGFLRQILVACVCVAVIEV